MSRFDALETRRATAFLLAGVLFVAFAGLWGAYAATDMTSRAIQDVVGPAGWTAAFVGLLGLRPGLADSAPRLSALGAVFAGLGVLGAGLSTVGNAVHLAGVVGDPPSWFAALQLLILVGIVPGFLTFAVATLRTDGRSRRTGVLLLAPAGIFAVNVVRVAELGATTPRWAPFVLGSAQALALLAIGYRLRIDGVPSDRVDPSPDAMAK